MKHSIGFRLNLLFVLLVTAVLSVSGWLTYLNTRQQLEQQYSEARRAVQQRLRTNLPLPIWNLDTALLQQNLTAELTSPVERIAVYEENGKLLLARGAEPVEAAAAERLDVPLALKQFNQTHALGHARVWLSRASIEAQLSSQVLNRVAEILALDAVLLIALSIALRLMVLNPLETLKDALALAAEHQGGEDSLTLLTERQDEFGEVVRSFNRIAQRLAEDVEKGRQAEAEIRLAYDNLKQAQATLMQSEKLAALGGLVAGIAHEINTPVGITLTCASLLGDKTRQLAGQLEAGQLKKSDVQGYVQTASESVGLIQVNAERAAHLVQSFKQVAVDQMSEERREFDLAGYLHEVIASLRPKFKHSAIRVSIDCAEGIRLDSYPGALAQIITNLLVNSLTHAFDEGQPGEVTIRAQQLGGEIALEFADNGKGIAPENLPRVFTPFFTTRRSAGGSGLGLHIVYNIVTGKLGGRLQVESRPNAGTRFTLQFPAVAPAVSEGKG
ncbi:sensor histidine kinase [Pseudogulbenkiania ferrooxidans]|uniref:histidine kinase n=1 Tax=Pseudogulbenkiania ferrooxidans 2002 TaxID=279714 RepID=B9Z814_9NEIS|nr:HAMP domain-containing sensor histidine kinase [Pseudogulbenkiania ferrooxidans]EEG07069.1 integral membrane sensor signal transduction histidine kinase [Pseudogulbenkiania ferrooxidans 2002]